MSVIEIRHSGETVTVSSSPQTVSARSPSYEVMVSSGVLDGMPYEGSYEVVPSAEPQELPTSGLVMRGNVTVGAIPSNYGLVTWNGSVLTVS